jgi:processive 1,2-diacylglycerol beta-glucosyltransferase
MPEAMGWLYDHLDKPWKNERRRLAFDALNTRPLVKLLKQYRPDVAVCTHFLPSEIISWLKAKQRFRCPQAIVVTDFDVHAMWLCHYYEQYFVALDETRVHMEKLGIRADRITVTGIPIDPVFAVSKDKAEMRARHDLAADKITLLVSAGGFGVGRVEDLYTCLSELKHEAQIVFLCGRNEELKKKLDKLSARLAGSRVTFKNLGFTTQVDELMSASDILLGKPGGLTTSEALAKGLAFVIVNPIPGQEERNSDHLLEEGVAIRCNNLPALAYKVDQLLEDRTRFARMQANARRLAHPNAAQDVVNRLLHLSRSAQ